MPHDSPIQCFTDMNEDESGWPPVSLSPCGLSETEIHKAFLTGGRGHVSRRSWGGLGRWETRAPPADLPQTCCETLYLCVLLSRPWILGKTM